MSSISDNNRIAKNTAILYVRMLFVIVVKLYTSRIILQALGVEDYGIYNVVGGIVVLFDFLNNAMSNSTQRYITVELGHKDSNQLNKVFITSINIHALISLIILILSETVGLYLLIYKMIIPESRFWAAFWVYQISVVTSIINIMSVPYGALIVANEKMSVFAYITLYEVAAKLAISYIIMFSPFNRLVLYAILMAGVQLSVRFINSIYCSKKLEGAKYHLYHDSCLFKEMSSFAGWNLVGNLSGVLATQGQNILLNMFFGPIVNAARAVAIQVQTTLYNFTSGFQTAINPQIIKTYAASELSKMHTLIFKSSRMSFLLLLIMCIPFFLEAPFIIKLWLGKVPEYTIIFLKIILVVSLIDCSANSLMNAAAATGKVKRYQLTCGLIVMMICPITYLALKAGCEPYIAFIVHLCISSTVYIARLIFLQNMINLKIKEFVKVVLYRCAIVTILTISIMIPIKYMMPENTINAFIVIAISVTYTSIITYIFGLTKSERDFIRRKLEFITRPIHTNK